MLSNQEKIRKDIEFFDNLPIGSDFYSCPDYGDGSFFRLHKFRLDDVFSYSLNKNLFEFKRSIFIYGPYNLCLEPKCNVQKNIDFFNSLKIGERFIRKSIDNPLYSDILEKKNEYDYQHIDGGTATYPFTINNSKYYYYTKLSVDINLDLI